MSDRQGVEIDYCPQCRGVWLDRGELDKIIERSLSGAPRQSSSSPGYINDAHPSYSEHHHKEHYEEHHGHGEHEHYKKKKREGLLGDLFDF